MVLMPEQSEDTQKGCSARPQGVRQPSRIPFPPAHPELPRQLNHRGYVAGRRATENAVREKARLGVPGLGG